MYRVSRRSRTSSSDSEPLSPCHHVPISTNVRRPKLDLQGRVVIPAEIRRDLDLKEGQEFAASTKNGVVLLVPVTVSVTPREP